MWDWVLVCFWHGTVCLLEQEQVQFKAALDLCGQLDAAVDLVGSNLKEVFIVEHHVGVFECI